MCHHLTVLAHASAYRAVAQCEHGALHVSWDITTLRLRPQDFMTLAQFLDRWGGPSEAPSITEGWCQLSRDRRGAVRLWIGQVGLALAATELNTLATLVRQSATILRVASDRPAAPRQAVWSCPVLTIDTKTLTTN
jgi:hypothetical protein